MKQGFLLFPLVVVSSIATAIASDPPASPQQAAKALDLTTFALVDPVDDESILKRRIAGQSYTAKGDVKSVSSRLRKQLVDSGWSAIPGGTSSGQSITEMFQKAGFTLTMSVSQSTTGSQVRVELMNHGNVDLGELALPAELKMQYQNAVMSMLQSPWSVEQTNQKIDEAMRNAGWEPYGSPRGLRQYKQNGIRLNISIMAAPGQDNRTMVQLSSEQLSADVPVPADAINVQYADTTRQVAFDHAASPAKVFALVRLRLGSMGWQATTDDPIKVGFREQLILRNDNGEIMQVESYEVEDKTRTLIRFRDSEEVARMQQQATAAAQQKKAEISEAASAAPIDVPRPSGSEVKSKSETKIEFTLESGEALAAIRAWTSQLKKQGWKVTVNAQERVAGDLTLEKDGLELNVTYVDPGFIPASISVSVFGKGAIRVK